MELPDAHPAFRFTVQIDGLPGATFTECTLPALEVEIEEQKEGGYNLGTHPLPGRVRRGTLTLKRGVAGGSDLMTWYTQVIQGQLIAARKEVSVTLLDDAGAPVIRYDFHMAFPTKWSGPELSAGSSAIAIESLELAYEMVTVS
jgi:phage tail-like protein